MEPTDELLEDIFRRLLSTGIPFVVGGSFASSAFGNRRSTNDLDICLAAKPGDAELITTAFADGFDLSIEEICNAIESSGEYNSFQLLDHEELFKVDVFIKPKTEFSDSEFDRVQWVDVSPELSAPFSSPETTILRKLLWFELGNRVSDRQWNDVVGVLEVQKGRLDEGYLDEWATKLDVKELLEKARSQVKPI